MIEILRIVASSWPIAVMALGAMVAVIVVDVIRWRKQSEKEDKAYRASQALVINRHDNAG